MLVRLVILKIFFKNSPGMVVGAEAELDERLNVLSMTNRERDRF